MTENEKSNTSATPTLHGEMTEDMEKTTATTANHHADPHRDSTGPASVYSRSKEDEMSEEDLALEKEEATAIQATRTKSEPEYISGWKLYSVLASQTLIFFLVMIDMSIVATATPKITSEFHSLPDVGWYGSAYQLACASLQPLAGKIYSNFRSKWTFLTFFAIFEFGSLLCGVATSSKMLIVARAVAGIGSSGLMNGGLTIMSACIPLHKRPKYFGIMMGCSQMGVVCGPLIGGAFTTYVTWRWCFYINLPVGAIAALLFIFVEVPETVQPRTETILKIIRTKLDLFGFAIFAPAAIQFFLALDYGGNQYPWNSSVVIGLFCGAGVMFILFLVWEYHEGDNAMMPFSMMRIREVWSSCLVSLLFFGCVQASTYYIPIYFQTVRQASAMLSGVYTLPSIITQLITGIVSGVFVGRLGYYLPWMVGSAMMWAVAGGLISTWSLHTATARWIGYMILLGFGRGLGMQIPLIAIQNSIPPTMVPISMALVAFSQTFGGSVFLTISETILSNSLTSNLAKYAPDVNAAAVVAAGASGVKQVVGDNQKQLDETLTAYAKSISNIFYFVVGASALMFCMSWFMGWKDIRKKDKKKDPVQDAERAAAAAWED